MDGGWGPVRRPDSPVRCHAFVQLLCLSLCLAQLVFGRMDPGVSDLEACSPGARLPPRITHTLLGTFQYLSSERKGTLSLGSVSGRKEYGEQSRGESSSTGNWGA